MLKYYLDIQLSSSFHAGNAEAPFSTSFRVSVFLIMAVLHKKKKIPSVTILTLKRLKRDDNDTFLSDNINMR